MQCPHPFVCLFWGVCFGAPKRPWLPQSHGQRTSALVEAVDLMPTYLALAGIATTTWDFSQLEGTSMVPLLAAGNHSSVSSHGRNGSGVAWKNATFSQYPRCNQSKTGAPPWVGPSNNACTGVVDSEFAAMGYSMRTGKALATGCCCCCCCCCLVFWGFFWLWCTTRPEARHDRHPGTNTAQTHSLSHSLSCFGAYVQYMRR